MLLKETYEDRKVHDSWEAVYRGNPLQDRLNARLLDRVLARLRPPAGGRVLDAGCGVGYHTLALAGRGFRCVGVDISQTVLDRAEENRRRLGLTEWAEFRCEPLEGLSLPDASFDLVHCRGVLMHVPGWQAALAQLCRVLKPGGAMVIMESNVWAVETALVRLLRLVRRGRSRVTATPGGLEFWSEEDGRPFVTRVADLGFLTRELGRHGLRVKGRLASEFFDIYRFPQGAVRDCVIRWNSFWLAAGLPAAPSMGNALLARKDA